MQQTGEHKDRSSKEGGGGGIEDGKNIGLWLRLKGGAKRGKITKIRGKKEEEKIRREKHHEGK